jgi:hypothetical protein
MTGKIIHISMLFIGFIILTSKSCEPDADTFPEARLKVKQDNTFKEIKNEFASEYLLENQLIAYGEKGKQKLFDFADYLCLYSAKNTDTLFRQQVKEMIYRLFYNKDAHIQLSVDNMHNPRRIKGNLHYLLNRINASKFKSLAFVISDLRTLAPLHREGIDKYTGEIECTFIISGISNNDTTLLNKTNIRVKIITTRTSKQFGTDKPLLVWQVFLDEVNAIH